MIGQKDAMRLVIYIIMASLLYVNMSFSETSDSLDIVYLKDGKVVIGQVAEVDYSRRIWIRDDNGLTDEVNIRDIKRIIRGASTDMSGYKDPSTAFFLSLLAPGLGQMYTGDVDNGLKFLVIGTGFGVYSLILAGDNDQGSPGLGIMMGLASSFIYIISLFDAPISASKHNRNLGLALYSPDCDRGYSRSDGRHRDEVSLGVCLTLRVGK